MPLCARLDGRAYALGLRAADRELPGRLGRLISGIDLVFDRYGRPVVGLGVKGTRRAANEENREYAEKETACSAETAATGNHKINADQFESNEMISGALPSTKGISIPRLLPI